MRFAETIGARLILAVTLSTSVIFAGMLGFNHLRSRALIETEVASSARYLALASAHRVEAALNTTARVVEIMARQLEQQNHNTSDAPALQRLLRRTLENNPEIYGTAIAFDYDGSGCGVRAGRRDGDGAGRCRRGWSRRRCPPAARSSSRILVVAEVRAGAGLLRPHRSQIDEGEAVLTRRHDKEILSIFCPCQMNKKVAASPRTAGTSGVSAGVVPAPGR